MIPHPMMDALWYFTKNDVKIAVEMPKIITVCLHISYFCRLPDEI